MIGLILALVDSVTNIFTDVARKKILNMGYDVSVVSFGCKVISCLFFILVISGMHWFLDIPVLLPNFGALFNGSTLIVFFIYIIINSILEGAAVLLNLKAIQISPLSYCVPFLALTPLFLLPTGVLFLHEKVSLGMLVGVFLVVSGALIVNRGLFAQGWLEPVKAILNQKGSRYMLYVAGLLTATNLLDKWFLIASGDTSFSIRLMRAITLSFGKCFMLSIVFWLLIRNKSSNDSQLELKRSRIFSKQKISQLLVMIRAVPSWLVIAGISEALVLILQLTALQYLVAALVISIKRAGMVFAVFLGWFIFKEKNIKDRLVASIVMTAGVLVFFISKPNQDGKLLIGNYGALAIACGVLLVAFFVLKNTKDENASIYEPNG